MQRAVFAGNRQVAVSISEIIWETQLELPLQGGSVTAASKVADPLIAGNERGREQRLLGTWQPVASPARLTDRPPASSFPPGAREAAFEHRREVAAWWTDRLRAAVNESQINRSSDRRPGTGRHWRCCTRRKHAALFPPSTWPLS